LLCCGQGCHQAGGVEPAAEQLLLDHHSGGEHVLAHGPPDDGVPGCLCLRAKARDELGHIRLLSALISHGSLLKRWFGGEGRGLLVRTVALLSKNDMNIFVKIQWSILFSQDLLF